MPAVALSLPRPSPGPAAACCRGKVGNKFCFTAAIVLSPNHTLCTPARHAPHAHPSLCVRCAPHAPQPFRETAAVARSENRSSDGAARTLFSPTLRRKQTRAPRRLPQAAPTRSQPPLPLPVRLVPTPLPAIATIILLLSLPARSPAARGGRRFGPETSSGRVRAPVCSSAAASPRAEPAAPDRQLGPRRRARPGQGSGCSRNPPRAARRGGIMSRPVCTAP